MPLSPAQLFDAFIDDTKPIAPCVAASSSMSVPISAMPITFPPSPIILPTAPINIYMKGTTITENDTVTLSRS